MGGKKSIIAMFLVVILAGGAGLGYSWHRESVNARTFSGSGYVLNPNTETETKRTLFGEGTVWKKGLSDTVVFDDVQGSRTEVDEKSFVHYDNNDLSALSDGVLVNLDDLDNGEITNHYALSSRVTCQWDGSGYQLGSGESAVSFTDCIWKLDADKYLLRSDNIQMSFAADDVRDAGEFVEVTYIDNGVIQLQTADNLWQTISENCEAILSSGERVNLSRKNVTDAAGNVLIDFAKIVVGSDDNIEITPDTKSLKDELDASKEEAGVIPHFDITAENGKAGAAGTSGTNGQSGTDGTIGDDGTDGSEGDPGDAGTAGGNGSAGASGSNGKNGSSGSSGSSGAAGTGATVDGTVLDYPKFNITDWAVTTTGCSGKITIKNTEMINRASEHANDGVYLIDVETGTRIDSIMGMDFKSETADGIEFKFENKLKPDHSYRLVVTACINTGLQNAQDYMRDFISKTFWTDSAGVMMEAGASTTTSVSLTVRQQGYTSRATSATVYLYSEKSRAQAATAEAPGADATYTANFPANSTSAPASFSGLTPNTYYYVRVAASGVMPSQVLTLRTLKRDPSMTNPQLSPNRDSWGFDITPGSIQDPDGAITSVTYYFYAENDTNSENAVHSVTVKKPSQSFTVPIEGTGLVKGSRYYVRAKLNFNDNEKDRTYWTGKSNVAQINGGKLPSVYFVNNGSGTTGDSSGSSTSSGYYDQIYGTLHVSPGSEGSRLLANENHHPTVTIRASGYYYVQYTVYNKDDSNKPQSGNYLTAIVTSDGCVEIEIPNKVLSEDGQVGTVSGLRPATQYQMIVTGDLSTDGTNVSEASARVGSCVVDTKKMSDANANWNDSDTLEGTNKFTTTLKLADATSTAEQADSSFSRQMDTLSTITLSLRAGTVANPGTELGRVTLTRDNYTSYLSAAQQADSANKVRSLGELMTKGLVMSENTFNTSNDPNFSQKLTYISSVCITVSEAKDYTANAANRVNQKAYASIDSNDISAPGASSSDGAVYINETKIVKDATHEITLGESPDAPPESGNGFDKSLLSQTTDPEKGYALSPNYLNSAKLARTITFYAFDNPDYTADYNTNDYTVDTHYPDSTPKMAATALKNGKGAWLGRLTVEVPQNGVMPKARFLPLTIDTYINKVYSDSAQREQAKAAYASGTLTDENGYYLFFLDDDHASETARGHQYTFEWTMTYELTSGDTTKTHYYPFELDAGSRSWADFVPHSLPQDAPYDEPKFYALPYETDLTDGTATWAVSIVDPDGVAVKDNDGKVPLYNRQSNSSDIDLKLSAVVDSQINAAFVTDGNHLVTVPKDICNTYGNAAVAARVQWYTNKYTNDGKGLFDGTNAMGYTADTVRYSSKTQSSSIPYYKNVFVLKNETLDTPTTTGISVVAEPTSPNGSGAINAFNVTVTGPQTELDKANAVRLTFKAGSKSVSIDEFIAGADGQSIGEDGSNYNVSFRVPIARELAELASTKDVSIKAELVYETNVEGFSYIANNDYSLRTYSMVSNSSLGSELKESGWYWFSTTGKLANNATEQLPRFGSFFTPDEAKLQFAVNDKTGQLLGSMSVASTRDSSLLPRRETMEFTLENGGASVNGLFIVPRVLSTKEIADCTYYGGSKTYDFPAIVPVISYSNTVGTANSVSTNYVVQPANSTIKFLLLKGTKAENSSNYSYNTVMNINNGRWEEVSFDETKVAQGNWLTDGSGNSISFNNLPADQHYRIVAYYKDSDGTWKQCNMYNDSGTEIVNSRDVNTISKPSVTMRAWYVRGSYVDKRIAVDVSVKDAANYYYTLELQDRNGVRLAYLPCGDDDSSTVKKTHLYSAGIWEISNPNSDFTDRFEYHGALYRCDGFDTEKHELNVTDERIYLNYGEDYTVRLRVYNKGFGPAYGGTENDDLMMSGLSSGEVEPSAEKSFTVPSAADTATLGGSFDLRSSNGNMVPTITFQPNYVSNSARIRYNRVAVAVIRKSADGSLEDVTKYAQYTGNENSDLTNHFINFGDKQYITLQEGNGLKFQPGDTFTCYLYAVIDDESATTAGFNTAVDTPSTILAGRALDGDKLMNTDSISVDHGESVLLASREVRYTSSETSAGTVSVQYRDGKFYLHLANPVNINAIHVLDWTVTAEYTDASGQTESADRTGIKDTLVLDSVADNEYEMELPADFGSELSGIDVTNYRITIQFFTDLGDGTYSSQGIAMTTNSSSGVVDSAADGGLKLTVNITPSRNLVAEIIDALFPTEEQPVQDGEQPTGDEPAEQPDDTAEPETPAEDEQPAEDSDSGTDADTPEDGQTDTTPPDSGTADEPDAPDTPAAEPSPQPSVSEPEKGGEAESGAADSSEQTDSGVAESGGSGETESASDESSGSSADEGDAE